jgi:hypothetical protein
MSACRVKCGGTAASAFREPQARASRPQRGFAMRFLGRMRSFVVPLTAFVLIVPAAAVGGPAPATLAAACQLGESEMGASTLYGISAPGMRVYTLLDPAACMACPSPSVLSLTAAGLRLRFNKSCSLALRVSVVGWMGMASCPRPDPAQVLCGPVEQVIAGVAGVVGAYAVPLPAGCCIQERAFLCLEVVGSPAGDRAVGFRTAGTGCVPCVQRWERGILSPGTWDLCETTYGLGRNLAIWADTECRNPAPGSPRGLGGVKPTRR